MNQREMVEKYINEFGSITPLDAFRDLGITKLATVVSDMKKLGFEFYQKYEAGQNRWGKPTKYMRYAFNEANLEQNKRFNIITLSKLKKLFK